MITVGWPADAEALRRGRRGSEVHGTRMPRIRPLPLLPLSRSSATFRKAEVR